MLINVVFGALNVEKCRLFRGFCKRMLQKLSFLGKYIQVDIVNILRKHDGQVDISRRVVGFLQGLHDI